MEKVWLNSEEIGRFDFCEGENKSSEPQKVSDLWVWYCIQLLRNPQSVPSLECGWNLGSPRTEFGDSIVQLLSLLYELFD